MSRGSYEIAEDFFEGHVFWVIRQRIGRFMLKRNSLIGSPVLRDGMPTLLYQAQGRFA
jgi:hypothetical protein